MRPAIIHILRAAGFYSAKPSVVDTLSDIALRYLQLLAERTAESTYDRSSNLTDKPVERETADQEAPPLDLPIPSITDIRMAMAACATFPSTTTAAEDAWREYMRRPLQTYHIAARDKEKQRREAEDTKDIQEFLDWVAGPTNKEIRRIAGMLPEEDDVGASTEAADSTAKTITKVTAKEDFLAILKKKHSKTGDEARYAGTVLGKAGDDRANVKIDGGPASLMDWRNELKRKRADTAAATVSGAAKQKVAG